jgi:hypothetical protein
MPYFNNSSEIYDSFGRLLSDLVTSDGIGESLRGTETSIRFVLSDPGAELTWILKADAPGVVLGSTAGTADLTLEMSADCVHELFLGMRDYWFDVASGTVSALGSAPTVGALWPAVQFTSRSRYAQILSDLDRADLIPTS